MADRSTYAARWPWLLALGTALAGLALTLYAWSRAAEREEAEALNRFRIEAESLKSNTQRELDLFAEVLESIRALHGLSSEIRSATLEEFVDKGMMHQIHVLGAFGFAQRISHPLREALEEAYEQNPAQGYRIVQLAESEWLPADPAPLYYPLTWQNRPLALHAPEGFDFASRPAARRAIQRMEQTGHMALALEPAAGHDHWVFSPIVYRGVGGPGTLIGFAIGLLNPETILVRARAATGATGLQVSLTPMLETSPTEAEVYRARHEWVMQDRIEVIDLPWQFLCRSPATLSARRSNAILMAGMIITLLMTSQLVVIANRSRHVEKEVKARTEDLHKAKGQLETEMEERTRLEAQMSELATHERQRLGRDLHDSLGQKLTGAVFLSRSLLHHFTSSEADEAKHARTLNETLKEAVGQVRSMARGLAPVTLHNESLADALSELAAEMTDLYGVSCETIEPLDEVVLDERTNEAVYFIAREAVNNACRHARANRVTVALRKTSSSISLVVEDDGIGIPSETAVASGMGLRIMRYRARMTGGEIRIEPRNEGGTRVEMTLPRV